VASEILAVPEEHLREVIFIIRAGLTATVCSDEVREALTRWCDGEELYLSGGLEE
jgi:hypothetical protein